MVKLVTDFSGMEVPTQALDRLKVPHVLISASEYRDAARQFIWENFKPLEMRHDAWTEPAIKTETEVDLYMAGFPCQPFSSLGKQEGVMDTKGRGIAAEVCIMRIANLKPRAFILENVVRARTFHNVLHNAFEVYFQLILTVISHVIQMIIQHRILADPVQY